MLVLEILQNDGLLLAQTFPLPLFPSFHRFLCYTHTIYRLFCLHIDIHTRTVHTLTQNTLASLVSDVPAVVDNEIPTGWETPGRLTDGPL